MQVQCRRIRAKLYNFRSFYIQVYDGPLSSDRLCPDCRERWTLTEGPSGTRIRSTHSTPRQLTGGLVGGSLLDTAALVGCVKVGRGRKRVCRLTHTSTPTLQVARIYRLDRVAGPWRAELPYENTSCVSYLRVGIESARNEIG